MLYDSSTAAEQRIGFALLLLPGDRLAQAVERLAVFRIDLVLEERVRALADMRVHIDDGVTVPTHDCSPIRAMPEAQPGFQSASGVIARDEDYAAGQCQL